MSKQKKVLIIEDEQAMANALSLKIGKLYQTLLAGDGQEGFEMAEKERPDFILLDIMMPKLNGMTVMKKIRAEKWGEDIPIVVLTNVNNPVQIAEAAKHGVYDFLVKTDWTLDAVAEVIKQKIDNIPEPLDEDERIAAKKIISKM